MKTDDMLVVLALALLVSLLYIGHGWTREPARRAVDQNVLCGKAVDCIPAR